MLLHVKKSLKLPNIIWKHSAHGKQTYRKHMPSQNHHVHTLRQSRDKPEMNGINAKCIRTNGDRGVRSIAVTHTSYTSFFSIPGDAACILKRCSAIAGTPYDWQIDEHVRFVHVLCVFFFLFFFRWKHVNMIDIINASFPAGRRRYTHSYTRLCCIRQNKRRERKGSHFVASTACAIQQTLCVYKYTNICCAFDKYTVINIAFGPTDLMQLARGICRFYPRFLSFDSILTKSPDGRTNLSLFLRSCDWWHLDCGSTTRTSSSRSKSYQKLLKSRRNKNPNLFKPKTHTQHTGKEKTYPQHTTICYDTIFHRCICWLRLRAAIYNALVFSVCVYHSFFFIFSPFSSSAHSCVYQTTIKNLFIADHYCLTYHIYTTHTHTHKHIYTQSFASRGPKNGEIHVCSCARARGRSHTLHIAMKTFLLTAWANNRKVWI